MRIAFLVLVIFSSGTCIADDNLRPQGTNCDLVSPPENAGEDFNHGATVRIFPRAQDIGSSYSGCQLMWVQAVGHWTIISVVEIRDGNAERSWSPTTQDHERFSCRYKNGQVVSGDAKSCAAAKSLIQKSLAAGCVDKLRKAMAVVDSDAPHPAGCEYE